MDLYTDIEQALLALAPLRDWPEAAAIVQQAAAAHDLHWRLPERACLAVGGTAAQARPGVAAIAALQIGIVLADDVLDADPEGWQHRLGTPAMPNMALAFQAAGTLAIAGAPIPPEQQAAALRRLGQMMLIVAQGQAQDAQNVAAEDAYWQIARRKSGSFFGAAVAVGAGLGDATPAAVAALFEFGQLVGEMVQVHDDLADTLAVPAGPDWLSGRWPLPLLFAHTVPHPEQVDFEVLRPLVTDPTCLQAAQAILLRCGAVGYCLYQLQARDQQARALLAELALPQPAALLAVLDELIRPVNDLLALPAPPAYN